MEVCLTFAFLKLSSLAVEIIVMQLASESEEQSITSISGDL